MSALISAIAFAVASPAAQAPAATPVPAPAPAPAPGKKCCCKDMAEPMSCCPKHGEDAERGDGHQAGHGMNH